jgi:hypothetical protein
MVTFGLVHGVQPIEIDGGHSPFLAIPAALAQTFDGLAAAAG